MRIDGPNNSGVIERPGSNKSGSTKGTGKAKDGEKSAVVVSIGEAAGDAKAASNRLEAEISARLSKVREQLSEGQYPIDYEKLAERIVDDETMRFGV